MRVKAGRPEPSGAQGPPESQELARLLPSLIARHGDTLKVPNEINIFRACPPRFGAIELTTAKNHILISASQTLPCSAKVYPERRPCRIGPPGS